MTLSPQNLNRVLCETHRSPPLPSPSRHARRGMFVALALASESAPRACTRRERSNCWEGQGLQARVEKRETANPRHRRRATGPSRGPFCSLFLISILLRATLRRVREFELVFERFGGPRRRRRREEFFFSFATFFVLFFSFSIGARASVEDERGMTLSLLCFLSSSPPPPSHLLPRPPPPPPLSFSRPPKKKQK